MQERELTAVPGSLAPLELPVGQINQGPLQIVDSAHGVSGMDHEPAQMACKDHKMEPTSGPLQRQDQPTVTELRVRVAADARIKARMRSLQRGRKQSGRLTTNA
jgi:hypothetical protein